jgi:hypothetical protein
MVLPLAVSLQPKASVSPCEVGALSTKAEASAPPTASRPTTVINFLNMRIVLSLGIGRCDGAMVLLGYASFLVMRADPPNAGVMR